MESLSRGWACFGGFIPSDSKRFAVSFCRNLCYNSFAVHPVIHGRGGETMEYIFTFLVSVAADVTSRFICKWLDRYDENRKA